MANRDDEEHARKTSTKGHVSITEPMLIWIILLLVAVAIRIIFANFNELTSASFVYSAAGAYSKFILQLPALAILPLVIGAIIGAEIGSRSLSPRRAAVSALLNGIYASLIYAVAIIILYLILGYGTSQQVSVYGMVLDSIAIPIAVLLVTTGVFALLSFYRRVDL